MDATVPPTAPTPRRWSAGLLPAAPTTAAISILAFTVVLYLIELVDQVSNLKLDQYGIESRRLGGLDGVVWAPLLHGGWGHLLANTIPFLVFGFLVMAGGIVQFLMVTALIWVVSGLGVWLVGPSVGVTVGMSGVIFGWLVFLLARGLFARQWKQVALGVVLFVIWGGLLFGVLPGRADISWQAHLFGALGGLLAAFLVGRSGRAAAKGIAA